MTNEDGAAGGGDGSVIVVRTSVMSTVDLSGGLYLRIHDLKKGKDIKKSTVAAAGLKPKNFDREVQDLNCPPPDLDIF
jgi:hypothetical protein